MFIRVRYNLRIHHPCGKDIKPKYVVRVVLLLNYSIDPCYNIHLLLTYYSSLCYSIVEITGSGIRPIDRVRYYD